MRAYFARHAGRAPFTSSSLGSNSRLLPPSAAEAQKLQKQLMQAGFRSQTAPGVYRAIQLMTMAGFPAIVALACALLAKPLSGAFLWIVSAFVVGFFLPRYALSPDITPARFSADRAATM